MGEMPIRKALVPVSFAGTFKESLEKMAPTRILEDDETPRTGWLVEGEFQLVDGGSPVGRFFFGHFGAGRSFLSMHVKMTDVGPRAWSSMNSTSLAGAGLQGRLARFARADWAKPPLRSRERGGAHLPRALAERAPLRHAQQHRVALKSLTNLPRFRRSGESKGDVGNASPFRLQGCARKPRRLRCVRF